MIISPEADCEIIPVGNGISPFTRVCSPKNIIPVGNGLDLTPLLTAVSDSHNSQEKDTDHAMGVDTREPWYKHITNIPTSPPHSPLPLPLDFLSSPPTTDHPRKTIDKHATGRISGVRALYLHCAPKSPPKSDSDSDTHPLTQADPPRPRAKRKSRKKLLVKKKSTKPSTTTKKCVRTKNTLTFPEYKSSKPYAKRSKSSSKSSKSTTPESYCTTSAPFPTTTNTSNDCGGSW